MKKNDQPRFFCQHCGADVPAHAVLCPRCGRFFSAVRCPQCDYSGRQGEFVHGCPRCGYSGGAASASDARTRRRTAPKRTRSLIPLFPFVLTVLIIAFAGLAVFYLQL